MNRTEFDEIVQAVRAKRNEATKEPQTTAKQDTTSDVDATSEHKINPLDVRQLVEETLHNARAQGQDTTVSAENAIRANAIADAFTSSQAQSTKDSYVPNDLLFGNDPQNELLDSSEQSQTNETEQLTPSSALQDPAESKVSSTTTAAANETLAENQPTSAATEPISTANELTSNAADFLESKQAQLQAIVAEKRAQLAALEASLNSINQLKQQAEAKPDADSTAEAQRTEAEKVIADVKTAIAEAKKALAEAKTDSDSTTNAEVESKTLSDAKVEDILDAEATLAAIKEAKTAKAKKTKQESTDQVNTANKDTLEDKAITSTKAEDMSGAKANQSKSKAEHESEVTPEPDMGLVDLPAHISLNKGPKAHEDQAAEPKQKKTQDENTELRFDDLLSAYAQVTEETHARLKVSDHSSKYQINAVALMRLVNLIEPVLSLLCETYTFERSHVQVSLTQFNQRLHQCFLYIERQCAGNLELKRAYADIEKPLYFFIDYFVHESKLSFSDQFDGLGRKINEFSGDEKFFELLDVALKENHANDKNYVFFLFMALGFQGAHKGNAVKLQHYMRSLSTRLETKLKLRPQLCLNLEQLTRDYDEEGHKTRKLLRNSLRLKRWMWGSVAVFFIAFGINNVIYHYATRDFQAALDNTIAEMFNYVKRKGGSEYMLEDALNTQRDSSLMTDALERFKADSNDFLGNFVKSQSNDQMAQTSDQAYIPSARTLIKAPVVDPSNGSVAPSNRAVTSSTATASPLDANKLVLQMPPASRTDQPSNIKINDFLSPLEDSPSSPLSKQSQPE